MRAFSALLGSALILPAVLAKTYDAVIVGGGLSGLAAAKELAENDKSFVVLEARDRVGGRVYNKPLKHQKGVVEVGAEFIGPTQDAVIALAKELGLELFKTYNDGNNVLWENGKRKTFKANGLLGAIPPEDVVTLAQLGTLQLKVDQMAKEIIKQPPWEYKKAAELDSKSVEQWIDEQKVTKAARSIITLSISEIFSASLSDLSMLYALYYIGAGGSKGNPGTFERMTQTKDGAQMYRMEGGTGLLPEKLADKIGMKHIKLGSPVASIRKSSNRKDTQYTVKTRGGEEYTAKHVIIAMSPPMADKIHFSPALPHDRQQIQKRMKMGSLGKSIAIYDKPFWRKKGLTGQTLSDNFTSRATFDSTPKDESFAALLGFIQDEQMTELDSKSEKEVSDAAGEAFVHYFGKHARNTTEWVIMRWDNEEFSGGGPTANAPVNVLSKYGKALREPVGNLHWAGTESADHWIGYMDGALRAGKRAASEVN